jgi:hypothetical protein
MRGSAMRPNSAPHAHRGREVTGRHRDLADVEQRAIGEGIDERA